MTNYLISYDITNDQLRNKIAKCLLKNGCRRLQKSLYLAKDFKLVELQQVQHELGPLIRSPRWGEKDTILCWPASNLQLTEMLWAGDEIAFNNKWQNKDWLLY